MSSKELDKLFHDKLQGLEKEPSGYAWNRLEEKISNKRKPVVWAYLKVAAAILLLFTVSIVIWKYSNHADHDNHQQMADTENNTKATLENEPLAIAKDDEQPSGAPKNKERTQAKNDVARVDNNRAKGPKNQAVSKSQLKQSKPLPGIKKPEPAELADSENPTYNKNKKEDNTATMKNQISEDQTGVTLEFDITDFEKSTMAKTEQGTQAAGEVVENIDKEKGLNKVFAFVKDVKEDIKLGELREAKNEILAFNFNKEKNDNSN